MAIKSSAIPILLFLLFTNQSHDILSQENKSIISGRVVDKSTGDPVMYADVFVSGTLWGTTTNKQGEYRISSVYPGEHELVVSILGFKTESKIINVGPGSKLNIDFKLDQQAVEFGEIEIRAESPDQWFEDLRLFKRLFLGKTEFAEECDITNEKLLEFDHPREDILTAKCKKPLKINNNALGFKISCILMNFQYSLRESRLQYMVKTQFQEMETESESQREEWIENRLEAYNGSLDHFLKCLMNNDFVENGFALSSSRIPSREGYNAFREDYWASDSLLTFISPDEARIYFPNYLQVIHKNSDIRPRPVSWIRMLYPDVYLDIYGYTRELVPFETSGYWAMLGMANMIPKYYYAVLNSPEEQSPE